MTIYSDIDLTLTTHPVTGDFVKKTDVGAVMQSLKNLIKTAETEILMEMGIGGGVDRVLFDINDSLTAYNLKTRIEQTIENHEPRIELKEVSVYRAENNKAIVAQIIFYFANGPEAIVENIVLERMR